MEGTVNHREPKFPVGEASQPTGSFMKISSDFLCCFHMLEILHFLIAFFSNSFG